MRRAFVLLFCLAALISLLYAQAQGPTAQAERGKDLFLKSPKGVACGTCHSLASVGTAVGPDLKIAGGGLPPRALARAIKMSTAEYVKKVNLTTGESFTGIQKTKGAEEVAIWDLTKSPPALRTMPAKQVVGFDRETGWKHPPASADYTLEELADIVGFLKWATMGSRTTIKVEDIE
jgi:hypothetical protein